jgi:hypothetical protein
MFLVFCVVAAIVVTWILLTISGWTSLRRTLKAPHSRAWPRLVMALLPMLIGYFLFNFNLRFSLNGKAMNLSWPFAIPMALGTVALYYWLRVDPRQSKLVSPSSELEPP